MSVGAVGAEAVELELGPAGAGGDRRRPAGEVAGDAGAGGVGEEVDGVAALRGGEALVDGDGERGGAAAGVVVGEAADLGLDHGALLGVDDAADPPVEKAEDQRGGDRDQHQVRRDQPHGGVAEHAASGAGGELVAAPRTVWISGGSPSASILRRRRLMWTSMTLVRGSKR